MPLLKGGKGYPQRAHSASISPGNNLMHPQRVPIEKRSNLAHNVFSEARNMQLPLTPCPNTGQALIQGAKMRKHG